MQDLQRDLVGLKSYTTGNGIQAQFQCSREGALARVAYRNSRVPAGRLSAQRNASGPSNRIGQRQYIWDVLGRLQEVRQQNTTLASYSSYRSDEHRHHSL